MAKCESCKPMGNPYTRADYERLREAQRLINEVLPIIDKIENCGTACDAFREVCAELSGRLSQLQAEFFTPAPRK